MAMRARIKAALNLAMAIATDQTPPSTSKPSRSNAAREEEEEEED